MIQKQLRQVYSVGRYDERWSKPSEASLEETKGNVQFLSGRLGMYWCGSWFLSQVLDSDIKDDIDVAPVPSINGKQATVIHGLGNCIYKDTKNPEAAWKWVEFLSGEEANKLSAEMGAAIPAYEGTADIWVDKNKAIIFLHLLQRQRNIPIHILYPKIQQSGNNIRQKNLRKHIIFR